MERVRFLAMGCGPYNKIATDATRGFKESELVEAFEKAIERFKETRTTTQKLFPYDAEEE